MNILFVLEKLARAGAETQTVDLANGLCDRGHNVHLFTYYPPFDLKASLSPQVTLHHVSRTARSTRNPVRRLGLDRDLVLRLARILDEQEIQAIVGVMAFSVLLAWLARRSSRLKSPVVASLHSMGPTQIRDVLAQRLVYGPLLRRVEHVTFVCAAQKEKRSERLPWLRNKSTVVYNGIDESKFRAGDHQAAGRALRQSLGIPADAFVFSCIAQFRPEKRHQLLVRAFAQLDGLSYLLLAGDGPCRGETSNLVAELGLEHCIFFLGNVADPRPTIAASDTTVLASRMEAFSMSMLESMALGVPLVATRAGGLSEAVIDGETGRLFNTGDIESLCEGMQYMRSHPERAVEMGERGARLVRERFTRTGMIRSVEEILESLTQ